MKELTAAEEKSLVEWQRQKKTITLTNGQWSTLTTYLLLSTNHRKGEAKAWADLSEEKNEDGNAKYKNAASNAAFWSEMIEDLEVIRQRIEEA